MRTWDPGASLTYLLAQHGVFRHLSHRLHLTALSISRSSMSRSQSGAASVAWRGAAKRGAASTKSESIAGKRATSPAF